MAAVLKLWREASTLILVTPSTLANGARLQLTSTAAGHGFMNDLDVLMVKRSSKSKFMPNMYVFPGGVAVNSDFSSKWLSVFSKLGVDAQGTLFEKLTERSTTAAPLFTRDRGPQFSGIPAEVAFRICAIRETFEESGVLLAVPAEQSRSKLTSLDNSALYPLSVHKDLKTIDAWRQKVNKDPNEFLNMCLELDLIPEVWSLYEWSNWLTPLRGEENMRRFDTIFFVCCVNHKPDTVEDTQEIVNTVWASPYKLLSAYYEQKGVLPAPQLYELSRLVNFRTASDLMSLVMQPDRDRVERWLPREVRIKDYIVQVMPGDDLYPDHEEEQNIQEYGMSLEELNHKCPNQHRMVVYFDSSLSQLVVLLYCTIAPKKGHVTPDTSILNSIQMKVKGKL